MNILVDPVFSAEPVGQVSLPGLFAALAGQEVQAFPRLRAHQRAAWHMFRVQLAALALVRVGEIDPSRDEAKWHDLLLGLTNGQTQPWTLMVEDRSCSAFLQPADPGGLRWEPVATPDALDLLISSKNHDLKVAVAVDSVPEDWIYALISLQTSEGFGGRGNYGIARMNGGSSSRVMLGFAPSGWGGQPDPSSWWARDLALVLRHRDAPTTLTRGGPSLLWTLPWPEDAQIPIRTIDPLAIEVCRRIRLCEINGTISAERANSKAARIDDEGLAGVLDDPWAPYTRVNPKSLTLSEGGRFDYRRMVDLLSDGEWCAPLAARLHDDEVAGEMVIVAEALARGNSKTGGLQSRILPMPARVRQAKNLTERISTVAAAQISEIEKADIALREAVALYAAGGDYERVGKPQRLRAAEARSRLNNFADRVFFDHLWTRIAAMEEGDEAQAVATRRFRTVLAEATRSELQRSFGAIPCPRINAPRARTRAARRLERALRVTELVETVHVR